MRTIIICLLLFCHYYSFGQTNISIEDNPPIAKAQKYVLRTIASPESAGSTNYSSASNIEAGQQVWLNAYNNTGFKFVKWMCADSLVSETAGFYFIMPANDVVLTAIFEYNPENPPQPDSLGLSHTLTVVALPENSGSFNVNKTLRMVEGESVNLYAYPNTGFTFDGWELGDTIIRSKEYRFTMGKKDTDVIARFTYNPENPSNPGSNYWNETTGEVIVDDFTPGRLSTAIYNAIGNSNSSDVTMITVAGQMNSSDFGIANNYDNCTLLDLSRVAGITEVPSYAFDYTNLESVYFPATIEMIGYRAFADCQNLSSLTCYAMTPPVLEDYVFKNVPEGLVVYVPAAAIAQYQDAEGWKDFTILPIQEDIRSISISLPEGTNAADYAQMWLELTNTKSGQRMHYVMTDRTQYIFANIIRNTSWNVVLRNERGDIFGQIDNVEVKDEDVSVAFTSLSKPQSVVLSVLTHDGQDVTAQTQITWMDSQGNYLAQGVSLTGLPTDYQIRYSVVLPQELAMTYITPQPVDYALTDGNNRITCKLNVIPQVKISGKVKDASTGLPVSKAVISASQTFGGKYSKTLNAKTGGNGEFMFDIANVPTSIAFAASDYISQTVNFDSLLVGIGAVTLPDVLLKTITGATITVDFTYTTCDGETQNWYSDYQNVNYSLFNITKNRVVSQYNVQYPQIVLLEEIEDGDVLRLTATSRTNAFMPIETTTTIAEQKAEATFGIVELGQIQSSFVTTGNASVVGSLYDEAGKLVKTYDYTNASLTISNLPDGQYTLVSMGSSRFFNTIYDLAQLPQTGLVEGADYVLNMVEVKGGAISQIRIDEVPVFDERKLYYTGDNTSFTVNKPSIVAGNYLTLTGRIDFKQAYATKVSNVQMIVDLPESCEFVENSVMVGNNTSSYTLNGNRITIPMTRYTDRVRFCVIPTVGGGYAPNAFAQFDIDGKTVTQPIGSANYTAKDLSISVPSTVAKTIIPVSGTAIGTSNIEIYDNGVLIGQTTSLANGTWTTTCELNEPYNLSRHQIYAKVTTKQGIELTSENVSCVYDMNAIQVSVVKMYHENPELRKTFELTFDFLSPSNKEENYIYYIYNKKFTFTIDFTNNDTTKVSDVILYVKTAKSGWHPLEATYDVKQGKWVASGEFGNMYDGDLPVNVSVDYTFNSIVAADFAQTNAFFDENEEMFELSEKFKKIESVLQRFSEKPHQIDPLIALVEEMLSPDDLAEIKSFEDSIYSFSDTQIDSLMDVYLNREITKDFEQQAEDISDEKYYQCYIDGYTYRYSTCEGIRMDDLTTDYLKINTISNDTVYVLNTNDRICYIDFRKNIYFEICKDADYKIMSIADKSEAEALWDWESFLLDEKLFKKLIKEKESAAKQHLKEFRKELGITKRCKNVGKINEHLDKAIAALKNHKGALNTVPKLSTMGKLAKGAPLVDLAINGHQFYDKYNQVNKITNSPTGCSSAENLALQQTYEKRAADMTKNAALYHTSNFALGTGTGALIAMAGAACPVSLIFTVPAAFAINYVADTWFDNKFEREADDLRQSYETLKRRCKGDKPKQKKGGQESNNPDKKFGIDPSGFVYEGVFSNRVQGATATVYYKEMVEDMYGDLHENIVKWDAEEYAQENPLFTDENGYYRWDVPQGLWQVKFEKEGYETTYSDWLPVPPPQLEVNIPMKQNVQPNVKSARAFENAVEVQFDKYMMPEMLTTENIMVLADENVVEGTIELLDEEVSYEGETDKYASKIRFNAKEPFSTEEVTLIVKNRVKSYAGIRMQDDYSQNFTVELEVRKIECDSVLAVIYGEQSTITVQVHPASAAAGKTLKVKSLAPLLLSVDKNAVTLDAEGKAEITISGDLPGSATLWFEVDGYDISATSIVKIGNMESLMVATPTTSIASGSEVAAGTEIYFSCATENAVIYYTLDGTCPCENTSSVIRYDGTPIVINETTTIKAIAYAEGMYESEVATFVYTVNNGLGIDEEKTGKYTVYPQLVKDIVNIDIPDDVSANVCIASVHGQTVYERKNMTGHNTVDMTGLTKGMYVVAIRDGNELVSIKIIKIGN